MVATITVGLVDGALDAEMPFLSAQHWCVEPVEDGHGASHAEALAATIRYHASSVRFANAVVFGAKQTCRRADVIEAVNWLLTDPPRILHCSFGLSESDDELADVFRRAVSACDVVVASMPVSGAVTYPAAYPGVVSVQSDARCGPRELSYLATDRAAFGAHGVSVTDEMVRGSAAAAAHVTGRIAAMLAAGADIRDTLDTLRLTATHSGPTR